MTVAIALPTMTATGQSAAQCGLRVDATTAPLSMTVLVNWNGDGSTYVDESSYCTSVSIRRGRANINDAVTTGRLSLILNNQTGRFSPENSLSALYPNVVVGRTVKVTASFHGVTYPQFVGMITEVAQNTLLRVASVTLTVLDSFELFRLAVAKHDFGAGVAADPTVDAVLTGILAAIAWAGATNFEVGRNLAVYAQTTTNVLQALQHAVKQEISGIFFAGKDGTLVFQNASHREQAAVAAVLTSVEAQTLGVRSTDIVQNIDVQYSTYRVNTRASIGAVFSGWAGITLPSQQTTTITDFFTALSATDIVTPVASTDYTANTSSDGSGLDVSANVGVLSFSSTGVDFTVSLYNSLPYAVYLTSFQIRGRSIEVNARAARFALSTSGSVIPSQRYSATFDYVTDVDAIALWAQRRLASLSAPHPRPSIKLVAKTDALTHLLLGADISTRVVLQDLNGGL